MAGLANVSELGADLARHWLKGILTRFLGFCLLIDQAS